MLSTTSSLISDNLSLPTDKDPQSASPPAPMSAILVVNSFFGVVFITGVLANLFVVFLILFLVGARKVTNIYIFNLAIADLMFIAWLPFVITRSVYGEWIWGNAVCKLFFICTTVNQFGSVAFLTALSIDRYVAVCFPVKALRLRKVTNAAVAVAVCWCSVALLMIPVYKYSTIVHIVEHDDSGNVSYSEHQCVILWPTDNGGSFSRSAFTIYSGVSGYLIPLVVIWVLYAQVLVRIRRRRTAAGKAKKRSHRKVTFMVLAVVMSYTICWSPFWILQFAFEVMDDETKQKKILQYLSLAAYCLQSANSVLNPVLYCFVSGAYGKAFWSKIKAKWEQRKKWAAANERARSFLPRALLQSSSPTMTDGRTQSDAGSDVSDVYPKVEFGKTDVWL